MTEIEVCFVSCASISKKYGDAQQIPSSGVVDKNRSYSMIEANKFLEKDRGQEHKPTKISELYLIHGSKILQPSIFLFPLKAKALAFDNENHLLIFQA